MTTLTLPRDLKPGDRIERTLNEDGRNWHHVDTVLATIKEVRPIKADGRRAYRVYLVERDEVPDNRKPWAQYKHLAPFTLFPTMKIEVHS